MRKNIDWKRFIITAYADTDQPIDVIMGDDIKKILTSKEEARFDKFMAGQTMLMLPGGQAGIYPCDFKFFIAGKPNTD